MKTIGNKSSVSPRHTDKRRVTMLLTVIVAVVSAIVLWFYALDYDSPDFSKTFTNISITVTGEEELRTSLGYTLLEEPDLTVDVTIVGKRTEVNQVRASDITASIDLSSVVAAGENKFTVQISAPNGTAVSSQSVSELRLYVDNFVSRQFPLQTGNLTYTLSADMYLDAVVFSPATVCVSGPESELDKIVGAYVDLELGELVNSVKVSAPVKLLDAEGAEINNAYILIGSRTVSASVGVYVEREVPVRVTLVGGVYSDDTAVITCDLRTVTLRGTVEQMESVTEYVIEIDETSTAFDLPIKVLINPDGGVINSGTAEYATVTVTIPDIGSARFNIDSESIGIIDPPEGYEVSVSGEVTVEVRGLYDVISGMTSDDISVYVDMSALGELSKGVYAVPVTVEITNEELSGVFIYNRNAYIVRITLK